MIVDIQGIATVQTILYLQIEYQGYQRDVRTV